MPHPPDFFCSCSHEIDFSAVFSTNFTRVVIIVRRRGVGPQAASSEPAASISHFYLQTEHFNWCVNVFWNLVTEEQQKNLATPLALTQRQFKGLVDYLF